MATPLPAITVNVDVCSSESWCVVDTIARHVGDIIAFAEFLDDEEFLLQCCRAETISLF